MDRAHYPDAVHLWTAEENGMDVFLTDGRKFLNVIRRQKVDLHCKALLPSKLVAHFPADGCRSEKQEQGRAIAGSWHAQDRDIPGGAGTDSHGPTDHPKK
jgi:hypothetical protein